MITLHDENNKEVLVNPNHIVMITHDNGCGVKDGSWIDCLGDHVVTVQEPPKEVKRLMDEFYRPKELPRCLTTL